MCPLRAVSRFSAGNARECSSRLCKLGERAGGIDISTCKLIDIYTTLIDSTVDRAKLTNQKLIKTSKLNKRSNKITGP